LIVCKITIILVNIKHDQSFVFSDEVALESQFLSGACLPGVVGVVLPEPSVLLLDEVTSYSSYPLLESDAARLALGRGLSFNFTSTGRPR